MIMKRTFLILMITFATFFTFSPPKAEAFIDPISLSLLTPAALQVAKEFAPYFIRGAIGASRGLVYMSRNFIDMFRLPFGALQATAGFPWGQFGNGVRNMVQGSLAPVKLIANIFLMPFYALSAFR
ncbi:hypothetical protein AAEX28_12650 [Lentisphaerota bacterium WC36G]|nr:hypothetical protein LJT99_15470 [Lentisphaerae bacterium WC36]